MLALRAVNAHTISLMPINWSTLAFARNGIRHEQPPLFFDGFLRGAHCRSLGLATLTIRVAHGYLGGKAHVMAFFSPLSELLSLAGTITHYKIFIALKRL